jgi:archaellum biogenesis protein FlaJ (TadC family)
LPPLVTANLPIAKSEVDMNAAHLHLLVNHLPIIGFAIGLLLLGVTLLRRGDRGMLLASVLVLVVAGGGALAAQFSGEPAEEAVRRLQDASKTLIETHEGAATVATIAAGITALIALFVLFFPWRRPVPVIPVSVLLLATAITCAAMGWTGLTGGKIRHPEVRGSASVSALR